MFSYTFGNTTTLNAAIERIDIHNIKKDKPVFFTFFFIVKKSEFNKINVIAIGIRTEETVSDREASRGNPLFAQIIPTA